MRVLLEARAAAAHGDESAWAEFEHEVVETQRKLAHGTLKKTRGAAPALRRSNEDWRRVTVRIQPRASELSEPKIPTRKYGVWGTRRMKTVRRKAPRTSMVRGAC